MTGPDRLPINSKPRPRLLVYGDFDDGVVEILRERVPTVHLVNDLATVNQSEYDVCVTNEPIPTLHSYSGVMRSVVRHGVAAHLYLVAFQVDYQTRWNVVEEVVVHEKSSDVRAEFGVVGSEIENVNYDVGDVLAGLMEEQLWRSATSRANHIGFRMATSDALDADPGFWRQPLGLLTTGHALGMLYRRTSGAEALLLPEYVPEVVPWVLAALWRWHDMAPERFPRLHDWRSAPEWQTAAEQQITDRIAREARELDEIVKAHEASAAVLEEELAVAQDDADTLERALLTARGDDLVRVVASVLEDFGFEVTDVDEMAEKGEDSSQLLEDLRVTDPDLPDWIALVEVRSYKGGAQTNDFQRIGRFCERMLMAEQRMPDRRWYIVNQFRDRSPEARYQVFASAPADVESFAEAGGAVFDTVELFKAHRALGLNGVDLSDCRRQMREVLGVFIAPDWDTPSNGSADSTDG